MSELWRSSFEAVRKACSPAVWSRGVELSRSDAVYCEHMDEDEAVFRVALRGGMLSRVVTLFLDDDDWDCECGSERHGCEHAAAAVIVWRRLEEAGEEIDRPAKRRGCIAYRFFEDGQALALRRVVAFAGEPDYPIQASLAAMAEGRVESPKFVASQADLAAEIALSGHRRGKLQGHVIPRLFKALRGAGEMTLAGEPVAISTDPVTQRCVLRDQDDGFLLTLEQDPGIERKYVNAVVLRGGTLHPLGRAGLTGREFERLPQGVLYGPDQVTELVTGVLPRLRKLLPVDVETDRLPGTEKEPPRIVVKTECEGTTLSVLALLVYGDPPHARVDAGRLVHLGGTIPQRDEDAERELLRRLAAELRLSPGIRVRFEAEEAVQFNRRLERWDGPVSGNAHERFKLMAPLAPQLDLNGDRLEVSFVSEGAAGEGGRADPKAVFRAWRDNAGLVPLLEGGWAPLPADWLARFGDRVADLLAARGNDGTVPRCCVPDLAALCDDLDQPPPPSFDALRPLLEDFDGLPSAELPGDLNAVLRGYQKRGVDWLGFLRSAGLGALLADDMGLGKTLQALCAIRGRTLVVAPTSVMHNWVAEAQRFRPALSLNVYHGPKRELSDADLTLTTYALLRLDTEKLTACRWDTVVLDEAQAIKNPDSQVAGAAFALQAGFRIALTGTPVENRLDELWSQFHFINRGLLGGRADFQDRYATPIGNADADAAARLRRRIRPFLLRRLKREVAPELPSRTEGVLRCELDVDERAVYDGVRAATLKNVVHQLGAGGGVMAALEALLRLRQAACHSALVPGQHAESSSKIALLLETLDSVVAEGHKALVFSQWTSLLDLCEPALEAAGIPFIRLDGSTRDRRAVVEGFQDAAGPPVMLISLKAGGTGLNLTAADHVFLLDPWWNPAVEDQAADRTHRIGQNRPVMIYRLVASDTVEERILALQQSKRELAQAALAEGSGATAIRREELLDLLR